LGRPASIRVIKGWEGQHPSGLLRVGKASIHQGYLLCIYNSYCYFELNQINGIHNLDINKYIDVDCIYAGARQQHNKIRTEEHTINLSQDKSTCRFHYPFDNSMVICQFHILLGILYLASQSKMYGLSWDNGIIRRIYNYLYICNQFLSPLKLWVWIPFIVRCTDTTLCNKVCQWQWQVCVFVRHNFFQWKEFNIKFYVTVNIL
jgi:hypothetical protein